MLILTFIFEDIGLFIICQDSIVKNEEPVITIITFKYCFVGASDKRSFKSR